MNYSLIYPNMCAKAHTIQHLKSRIGWYDQYDMVYVNMTGQKVLAIQLVRNETSTETCWLPTQTQLQNLILQDKYKSESIDSDPIKTLTHNFFKWYEKEFPAATDFTRSTNYDQLWLMYYMELKYKMYWCFPCNTWKMLKYKPIQPETDLIAIGVAAPGK